MLRIRLRRMGNRNRPFYRVVVSDSRKTPTASAVEEVGHYNPTSNPPEVRIDAERVRHWVGIGAQPSPTVLKLLKVQEKGRLGQSETLETDAEQQAAGPEVPDSEETPEPVATPDGAERPEATAS